MRARDSAFALLLVLVPTTAAADPGPVRGINLGLSVVQPLPPWTDAGFGLAPWVGFTVPVRGSWSATARAGWMVHMDKKITVGANPGETVRYEHAELPILVGVEYARGGRRGFLLTGELGYVLRRSRADYAHEPDASRVDHSAGVAIGGGYRISSFRALLQLCMLGLPDPVKHKAVMLGVQWLFPV